MSTQISGASQFDTLLSGSLPVIAKFSGKQCPPCIQNQPIFDQVASSNSKKAHFVVIYSDVCGDLFQRYGVRSMPTFIYFATVDGKKSETNRITGASSFETDVESFLTKYGKSVFEMSKGHSFGDSGSTKTETKAESGAKSTDDGKSARKPPNNPWANRNFNPKKQMEQNTGVKATDEKQQDVAALLKLDEPTGDAKMVCDPNGVCTLKKD